MYAVVERLPDPGAVGLGARGRPTTAWAGEIGVTCGLLDVLVCWAEVTEMWSFTIEVTDVFKRRRDVDRQRHRRGSARWHAEPAPDGLAATTRVPPSLAETKWCGPEAGR